MKNFEGLVVPVAFIDDLFFIVCTGNSYSIDCFCRTHHLSEEGDYYSVFLAHSDLKIQGLFS